MNRMEQFEKRVSVIKSLNSGNHSHLLYGLVRWLRPQQIVEVGSFAGHSTAWLAKGLQDNGMDGTVYAIDNFTLGTTPDMLHNNMMMLGLANLVTIVNANSQELPQFPPCELAFIDGDHSYEGCKADVEKAVNAGATCIVIHDTIDWWGPHEFMQSPVPLPGYTYINFPGDGGLAVFMKSFKWEQFNVQYTKEQFPNGCI